MPAIHLVPYDPDWPGAFAAERDRIAAALADVAVRIDHNGSTSVRGLAAKPVIDIQISVRGLQPLEPYAAALTELEAVTAQSIRAAALAVTLKRWSLALDCTRADGQHCQSWLWSAPAKHSTRQIAEVLERIAFLTELGIDQHLGDLNDVLVRRYARRMASRPPSVSSSPSRASRKRPPTPRARNICRRPGSAARAASISSRSCRTSNSAMR